MSSIGVRVRENNRWHFLALVVLAGLAAWGCGASVPAIPVVTISPNSVSLQTGGGQQQFTVTVTNVSNSAVVWKVDGQLNGNSTDGTINQSGLYQAPTAVPAGGSVTVEAISVANDNASASAAVTLTPGVSLVLTPATVTLGASGTEQFQATVTNITNTGVTWAVNGTAGGSSSVGTISATGLYTAPATFPGLSQVKVTATSVADTTVSAAAVVTLTQAVAVSINPTTASIALKHSLTFTASVSGSATTSVAWSVNGISGGNASVGTITAAGVFTAPAALPSPATETVTATSTADPTKSASAQLTIVQPVAVAINPTTAQLTLGATQTFTVTVSNTANTAVTWSVNGTAGGSASLGTISPGGVYTAPATMPGTTTVTVTATSVADPTAVANAAVTLQAPIAVTISPTSATVNLGAQQSFQATVTGGNGSNTAVNWSVDKTAGGNPTLGTINAQGVFTAPATLPSPATETITATSTADATQSASAQVTLQAPPNEITFTPAGSTLSVGKAQTGTATLQLTLSAGFSNPVALAVSGEPVDVSATVSPVSTSASGAVTLSVHTAPISLAVSGVPITITATSKNSSGNALVQTATVNLTITGWTGVVSTLAGQPGGPGFEDGSGTQDELYATTVTSDGGSNLFFADKAGNALRQFSLSSGIVTTLIGSQYNYTIGEGDGMAYDPATETMYVADSLQNRIVTYTLGTGDTLKVIAGGNGSGDNDGAGAASSFDSPHGLALSPDGKTLYVADTYNGLIRAVDLTNDTVTTVAGQAGKFNSVDGVGTQAEFCSPTGLAIDPSGNDLYISDQCGYVIRRMALPSYAVTTVAGQKGTPGDADGAALTKAEFDASLGALATDPHSGPDIVYIADGNQIRALKTGSNPVVYTVAGNDSTGASNGSGGSASFDQPLGLTAWADLNGAGTTSVFVADSLNGLLRRIDISNPLTTTGDSDIIASVTTVAGQTPHRGSTDGTGTGADYSGTSTALMDAPEGIVTDGKIAYVSDSDDGAIREIDIATSQVTTVAGPALGYSDGTATNCTGSEKCAAFYHEAGLAWLPSQNLLYIADAGNGAIRKLDLSTNTVTTVAGTNSAGYVDGPAAQARFNHPFGILVSADGTKLYIADTGNNVIREVDLATGMVNTVAGSGGLGEADGIGKAATFSEPNGLAWDPADPTQQTIFISDYEGADIRELNLASGQVTTILGMDHTCGYTDGPASSATLCDPAGLASDGHSLIWGDSGMGLLRALDLTTMQVYTLAGSPGLMHMANGTFTAATGTALNELTGPVRYNRPFGIALAPDGSFILITNEYENVVRIVH
ncbi:MAG: hypothetical protein ACRD04_00440 [Terriglobales bacterium]